MTAYNRTTLKSAFVGGTSLTEDKMEQLIDSFVNLAEDAVVIGPTGVTGSYTVLGPTGGTYNAILGPTGATFFDGYFSTGSTPSGPTATGLKGQIEIGPSGIFVFDAVTNYWIHLSGSTSF